MDQSSSPGTSLLQPNAFGTSSSHPSTFLCPPVSSGWFLPLEPLLASHGHPGKADLWKDRRETPLLPHLPREHTPGGSCFPRITMKKKLCANNRSIEPPAPSEGKQTPGSPQIRECFASLHPNRLTIFLGCCHGDRVTQRSACCRTIN